MSESVEFSGELPRPTSPFLSGDIFTHPVVEGQVAKLFIMHGGEAEFKVTEDADVQNAWIDTNLREMAARESVGDIDDEHPFISEEVSLPPVIVVTLSEAERAVAKGIVEKVIDTVDPKGRAVQRLLIRELEDEAEGFKPGSLYDVWKFPNQTAFHFLTIDGQKVDGIDWQLATTVEVEPDWYKG